MGERGVSSTRGSVDSLAMMMMVRRWMLDLSGEVNVGIPAGVGGETGPYSAYLAAEASGLRGLRGLWGALAAGTV